MKKEQSVALILLKDIGPVILIWVIWVLIIIKFFY